MSSSLVVLLAKSSSSSSSSSRTTTPTLAFASKSIPPPPPISMPVYSLAVSSPSTHETNMNIVTYCTPVSVAAPKLWTLSLYKNTLTKDIFLHDDKRIGILQLLDKKHGHLVPILGKRSGYEEDYNKELECSKIGYPWVDSKKNKNDINIGELEEEEMDRFQSIKVLPGCQSYIKFQILDTMDAGDHEVALCQVLGVGRWDENSQCVIPIDMNGVQEPKDETHVLYTGYLRKEGMI